MIVIDSTLNTETKKLHDRHTEVSAVFDSRERNLHEMKHTQLYFTTHVKKTLNIHN